MTEKEKYKFIVYSTIGSAMEVFRTLGRGLLESVYQEALSIELQNRGIIHSLEQEVPAFYKGQLLKKKFRIDVLIENEIVVELKSVSELTPEHRHQLCNYLRLTQKGIGLLINFGEESLYTERWLYNKNTNECQLVNRELVPIQEEYKW